MTKIDRTYSRKIFIAGQWHFDEIEGQFLGLPSQGFYSVKTLEPILLIVIESKFHPNVKTKPVLVSVREIPSYAYHHTPGLKDKLPLKVLYQIFLHNLSCLENNNDLS